MNIHFGPINLKAKTWNLHSDEGALALSLDEIGYLRRPVFLDYYRQRCWTSVYMPFVCKVMIIRAIYICLFSVQAVNHDRVDN